MIPNPNDFVLLPQPRQIEFHAGTAGAALHERLDKSVAHAEGYRLTIMPAGIELAGHDAAGLFYARQTLAQLRQMYGEKLACLTIEDWPDFPARGVMLDISRDKVPTLDTVKKLVDELSRWKINQLQLYMEHTFAYAGHETVWQNASPFTVAEIRELDAYCQARFVELVPNQNSFGHMERWLKHPQYLPLAEAPAGSDTPWNSHWDGPFSLCPTDPRSLELLRDLYQQLLSNFSSRLFNVGCDETFDVGQGRSKAQVEARGKTRVYLEFLHEVNKLVQAHGRRMMFWGDIILHEPALVKELPKDVIALEWGYEAAHPFAADGKIFADAGIDFYVCPGTSSWCSIAGRSDNALANLLSAAAQGKKHRAIGYLNTDWGDHGHLQYLPISYLGLARGAALAWCVESNRDVPIADVLNQYVFHDKAGVMGKLAYDLGNVYQLVGKPRSNRSILFSILTTKGNLVEPEAEITADGLRAAAGAVEQIMSRLPAARMARPDSALIIDEFTNAAAMLRLACHRGLETATPEELQHMVAEHRRLWLARNRPGGLEDSVGRLTI